MALIPRVNWGTQVPGWCPDWADRVCVSRVQWDLTFGKAGMMDSWMGRG